MWYNTDTFKNKNGDKVKSINEGPVTLNVETDLDVFVVAPNFVWVSPWKILGARYGAFMTPPS
jgi:hypothetical protein